MVLIYFLFHRYFTYKSIVNWKWLRF